ncbi:MAG: hypothetical protein ABIR84_12855, partial [Candidatus Nitrotoga sp.]
NYIWCKHYVSNRSGSMNNFTVEIKRNDPLFKSTVKINGDALTFSSMNQESKSAGNKITAAIVEPDRGKFY